MAQANATGAFFVYYSLIFLGFLLFYWRERGREVDFVMRMGKRVVAIEVKSGASRGSLPGMEAFARTFRPQQTLLVGGDGLPLEQFFQMPATALITG